ncbi:MAG TPA: hypothetical protein VML19_03530 [Verrucomicrobiae bacterium]|nr:hypothetical protein [Verrucomicrobiae bacterium]
MKFRCLFISALIGVSPALCQPNMLNQPLNQLPSRILGHFLPEQLTVTTTAPNLVDGVEMWRPQGIALDTSATPPIVYVADTLNNRILAWKNAASFSNGAKADLVIGQNNMYSTLPQGPGVNPPTPAGMAFPSGLTVDSKGALYVVDSGNNRILRYPSPFAQKQSLITPDLVIGQPNLNSNASNYFASASVQINEQCISTVLTGAGPLTAGLAFDSSGNLWFTDVGNARVLRYPAANIPAPNVGSTTGGIRADLVIGQPSLTTLNAAAITAQGANQMQIKDQFGLLATLGFDSAGRLYVVDSYGDNAEALGRVLVFANPGALPAGNGSADRIMGVITGAAELTALGYTPGTAAATAFQFQTFFASPNGIFFLPDGKIGIVDTGYSRLLIFPSYGSWPAESAQYSPTALASVGQGSSTNFTSYYPNNAQSKTLLTTGATPPAAASTLSQPSAAIYSPTNEIFVTDAANNRVVVLPVSAGDAIGSATRVLGQTTTTQNQPNFIEGREFFFTNGGAGEAALAIDTSSSVPHLYVADPFNNRVLGFYDARKVAADARADLVIGQPDFGTALCNYPSGDPTSPTQTSLCVPVGLTVDSAGNLYVADSLNGRVLRFPAPFAGGSSPAAMPKADMVIGQTGFSAQVRQASASTMVAPFGLAITGKNGLLVSDSALNRVTYYPFSGNGTFNPQTDSGNLTPSKVFGQSDFVSKLAGTGASNFSTPLGIAADSFGRLYVADAGNNRISVFSDPNSQLTTSGSRAILTIPNLGAPEDVFINPATDEIWIANTSNSTCLRFPPYNNLFPGATPENPSIPAVSAPLALALDSNGALYVADATNRVAVYYPSLQALNGANFLADFPIAPGMYASLCSPGSNCSGGSGVFASTTFAPTAQLFSTVPMATVLGDVMVTVNGTAAPVEYVSPTQINFYVPSNAPTSGIANIEVSQASTGQVLAAGLAQMNAISPGIFTSTIYSSTQRQAAVLNEDNSVNSPTNPAQRGHLIQIFGTGQGVYPGWPADGAPAGPGNLVPKGLTSVLINACLVNDSNTVLENCTPAPGDVGQSGAPRSTWIPFSGLAPGEIGVWQVNVQIPMGVPPKSTVPVILFVNDSPSNDSPHPAFQAVIYVGQ